MMPPPGVEQGGPNWIALLVYAATLLAAAAIYGGPSEPRNP